MQLQCALEPVKLRLSAELMVYRLVQEAITNKSKYAKARKVWVSLAAQNGQVRVSAVRGRPTRTRSSDLQTRGSAADRCAA